MCVCVFLLGVSEARRIEFFPPRTETRPASAGVKRTMPKHVVTTVRPEEHDYVGQSVGLLPKSRAKPPKKIGPPPLEGAHVALLIESIVCIF